ncbi:hypothetical protein COCNU_14G004100 [Cocos nucifera]|uniref:Uncharacterized protein n=1 Tax=Cocos nucifera TaxID=13894 RepID=A0A8K0IUG4_COCNU|nr:hypothetical protein COCNU_14G004100 [Cocos nucifera]
MPRLPDSASLKSSMAAVMGLSPRRKSGSSRRTVWMGWGRSGTRKVSSSLETARWGRWRRGAPMTQTGKRPTAWKERRGTPRSRAMVVVQGKWASATTASGRWRRSWSGRVRREAASILWHSGGKGADVLDAGGEAGGGGREGVEKGAEGEAGGGSAVDCGLDEGGVGRGEEDGGVDAAGGKKSGDVDQGDHVARREEGDKENAEWACGLRFTGDGTHGSRVFLKSKCAVYGEFG